MGEKRKNSLSIHFGKNCLGLASWNFAWICYCGNSSFGWSWEVDKQLKTCSPVMAAVWSLSIPLLIVPFFSYSFVPMVSGWALFGSSDPSVDLNGRTRLLSLGFGMTTSWCGLTLPPTLSNSLLVNSLLPQTRFWGVQGTILASWVPWTSCIIYLFIYF